MEINTSYKLTLNQLIEILSKFEFVKKVWFNAYNYFQLLADYEQLLVNSTEKSDILAKFITTTKLEDFKNCHYATYNDIKFYLSNKISKDHIIISSDQDDIDLDPSKFISLK